MYKKIILLAYVVFFVACEEIIEVELDDADPQIVIEAKVSDNSDINKVSITLSTDFYEPGEYESISQAEVIVTEVNGESYNFIETSSGLYTGENLTASVGSTYSIAVNYNDITYSAQSTLKQKLTIDSLQITEENGRFHGDFYEIHCYFQDHPGYEDYARFKVYVNGVERDKDGIFGYEDRLSDGNFIDNRFEINQEDDDEKLKIGDLITIELLTIDEAAYKYFTTLEDVLAVSEERGFIGGSTPGNPTTNWDNDALGYFSAYSVDTKSIVIK